jgi:hypothetical protein
MQSLSTSVKDRLTGALGKSVLSSLLFFVIFSVPDTELVTLGTDSGPLFQYPKRYESEFLNCAVLDGNGL